MTNEIKYYANVFLKKEIIPISLCISQFEREQIDYKNLECKLNNMGIKLKPIFIDYSKIKDAKIDKAKLKQRIITETLIPSDINGYLIANNNYKNILVKYDLFMIELLAEYGDIRSQKILDQILASKYCLPLQSINLK